jgi:hypothetical protein
VSEIIAAKVRDVARREEQGLTAGTRAFVEGAHRPTDEQQMLPLWAVNVCHDAGARRRHEARDRIFFRALTSPWVRADGGGPRRIGPPFPFSSGRRALLVASFIVADWL